MPYQRGNRLPGERASKLGHLEVLDSQLVNQLCQNFEESGVLSSDATEAWQPIPSNDNPLTIVFGVDGSIQSIRSETPPHKEMAFVKTALLKIDDYALGKIDTTTPHPFALRDVMADSAVYHATVFPLKHVTIAGKTVYHAVREVIFESMKDASLNGEPLETLKWLAYEKWDGIAKSLDLFECPHCEEKVATLPFDEEEGACPSCGGQLFITDMLGFHLDMAPDAVSDSVATAYMNIHETMLMFTGIRHFWENARQQLDKCLFIKDGPLSIRAQYSKLVAPIRRLLAYAYEQKTPIYLFGQEKTGQFFDHLQLIGKSAPEGSMFIPNDEYIKTSINHRPNKGAPYGKDTNYGAKIFVKLSHFHQMVISVPTTKSRFVLNPQLGDLLGIQRIVATLPRILSNKYEGALLPIELAHGVASLSTYPSAQILKLFANSRVR